MQCGIEFITGWTAFSMLPHIVGMCSAMVDHVCLYLYSDTYHVHPVVWKSDLKYNFG